MVSHKTKGKKLVSYTVDHTLVEQFNKYCKKNSINKSLLIENYIKKLLENNKTPEDLDIFLSLDL